MSRNSQNSTEPELNCRDHHSPQIFPTLSQEKSPFYLCKIHFSIIIPPTLGLSSGLLPLCLPTNTLFSLLFYLLCVPHAPPILHSYQFNVLQSVISVALVTQSVKSIWPQETD